MSCCALVTGVHACALPILVGGDARGLDLGVVLVVVVAAHEDVGAAGSHEVRGVARGRVQGEAERQRGRAENLGVHVRLLSAVRTHLPWWPDSRTCRDRPSRGYGKGRYDRVRIRGMR